MSMSQKPKVLVGCPTCDIYGYCLQEYLQGIKELTYPNFDILLVDNSKDEEYYKKININVVRAGYLEPAIKRIVNSRNILRKEVLEKYDYFLSLEQDVIPPKDVIERMLAHEKKVVSAVVFNSYKRKLLPMVWKESRDKLRFLNPEELDPPRLEKVRTVSLSCLLIHKDVLKEIEFRYEEDKKCFDDMFFSNDLKERGISLYVDTSIKCKHLIKNKSWKEIQKY